MSILSGTIKRRYGYGEVSYCIDDAKKDAIIKHLIDFYRECGTSGESLHQNDEACIEAIAVLADICDMHFDFKSVGECPEDDNSSGKNRVMEITAIAEYESSSNDDLEFYEGIGNSIKSCINGYSGVRCLGYSIEEVKDFK